MEQDVFVVKVPLGDMILEHKDDMRNVPENVPENILVILEKKERTSNFLSKKRDGDARRKFLLTLIGENPHLTISEMASACRVDSKTIKRYLEVLKKNGFLERIGSDKGGYWKKK